MPVVTVAISTWNRAHLVGRAIRSAANQTFVDTEILVVDDASTDETPHVLAAQLLPSDPSDDLPAPRPDPNFACAGDVGGTAPAPYSFQPISRILVPPITAPWATADLTFSGDGTTRLIAMTRSRYMPAKFGIGADELSAP